MRHGRCGTTPPACIAPTPNLELAVDDIFGPLVEIAVKNFQQGAGLAGGGTVDALTWNALPDANPSARFIRRCRSRFANTFKTDAAVNGQTPLGVDGDFEPQTKASVEAFQLWGGGAMDGMVGARP